MKKYNVYKLTCGYDDETDQAYWHRSKVTTVAAEDLDAAFKKAQTETGVAASNLRVLEAGTKVKKHGYYTRGGSDYRRLKEEYFGEMSEEELESYNNL